MVQKLHRAATEALKYAVVRDWLRPLGVDIVAPERRSPEYLAGFLEDEIAQWTVPIKTSDITVARSSADLWLTINLTLVACPP